MLLFGTCVIRTGCAIEPANLRFVPRKCSVLGLSVPDMQPSPSLYAGLCVSGLSCVLTWHPHPTCRCSMDRVEGDSTTTGFSGHQQQQANQITAGLPTRPAPPLQPLQGAQSQQAGEAPPQTHSTSAAVGLALDTLDPVPGGDLPLDLPMLTPRTLKASGIEDVQWGDFLALDDIADLDGVLEGLTMDDRAGGGGQGGGIASTGVPTGSGPGVDNSNKQGSMVSC